MQFNTNTPAFWAIILLTIIITLYSALPEESPSTQLALCLSTAAATAGLFFTWLMPKIEANAARTRELEQRLTDASENHTKEVNSLTNDVTQARAELQKSLTRCYRIEKERDGAVREKDKVLREAKETTPAWVPTKMQRERAAAEEKRKEEERRMREREEWRKEEEQQRLLNNERQASEGSVTVSAGGEQLAAADPKVKAELGKMGAELEEARARQRQTMTLLGEERKARVMERRTFEQETQTLTQKLHTTEEALTAANASLSAAASKIAELERSAADDELERSCLQYLQCDHDEEMVSDAEQWRLLHSNLRQAKESGKIQQVEIYALLDVMWETLATQHGQIEFQSGEMRRQAAVITSQDAQMRKDAQEIKELKAELEGRLSQEEAKKLQDKVAEAEEMIRVYDEANKEDALAYSRLEIKMKKMEKDLTEEKKAVEKKLGAAEDRIKQQALKLRAANGEVEKLQAAIDALKAEMANIKGNLLRDGDAGTDESSSIAEEKKMKLEWYEQYSRKLKQYNQLRAQYDGLVQKLKDFGMDVGDLVKSGT